MAQKFIRSEAFARVKGRDDKRHAMAVVVGLGGRPSPIIEEFDVTDADRETVNNLVRLVEAALKTGPGGRKAITLAALAEVSARVMQRDEKSQKDDKVVRVVTQ